MHLERERERESKQSKEREQASKRDTERDHLVYRTGNQTSLDTAVSAKFVDDFVDTVSDVGGAALGTITDPGLWTCAWGMSALL